MSIQPNTPAERAMLVQLPEGTEVEVRALKNGVLLNTRDVSGVWEFSRFRYSLPTPKPRTIRIEFECPMPVVEALEAALNYAAGEICQHEETHRGGVLWEICDQCGASWADDMGGRPESKWPRLLSDAQNAVSLLKEAVARAVKEAK